MKGKQQVSVGEVGVSRRTKGAARCGGLGGAGEPWGIAHGARYPSDPALQGEGRTSMKSGTVRMRVLSALSGAETPTGSSLLPHPPMHSRAPPVTKDRAGLLDP